MKKHTHSPNGGRMAHNRRSIRLKNYDYSAAGLYFITICCQNKTCRFGEIIVDESRLGVRMKLNEYGTIAYNEWVKLSERFANFKLDVFQIMPNHIHGIILLTDITKNIVGAGFTPDPTIPQHPDPNIPNQNGPNIPINPHPNIPNHPDPNIPINPVAPKIHQPKTNDPDWLTQHPVMGANTNATIGEIVGAYKSLVANACLKIYITKNEIMGKLWQRNYYEHIIRDEQSYFAISKYIINNPIKWNNDKFCAK